MPLMPDEAERGYDIETLKTRRRGPPMLGTAPAEVVPVRLDPDLKRAVEARAKAEHTTTSAIIREALRGSLTSPDLTRRRTSRPAVHVG